MIEDLTPSPTPLFDQEKFFDISLLNGGMFVMYCACNHRPNALSLVLMDQI